MFLLEKSNATDLKASKPQHDLTDTDFDKEVLKNPEHYPQSVVEKALDSDLKN